MGGIYRSPLRNFCVSKAKEKRFPTNGVKYGAIGGLLLSPFFLMATRDNTEVKRYVRMKGEMIATTIVVLQSLIARAVPCARSPWSVDCCMSV